MHKKFNNIINKILDSRHKCLILLVIFIFWLMLGPELNKKCSSLIMPLYLLFFTVGPYIITRNRHLLLFSLIMGITAYTLRVFYHGDIDYRKPVVEIALLFFDLTMTTCLVYYTTVSGKYSRDSIFGCIFVFMMIGVCFADIYFILQDHGLIAFATNGIPIASLSLEDCLYFSFTSLTTMGYGDIMPYTPLTKRLSYLEGVISIMYSAIFVGRLLTTYNSRKAEPA